MRVLVLGGSGSIGRAIVRELALAGHEVLALARSAAAAESVAARGAVPLAGDLTAPREWIGRLPALDAAIHAAATGRRDEQAIDRALLEALLPRLRAASARFLYTGGCWLFGTSPGTAMTEAAAVAPLPEWAWSVQHIEYVLGSGTHAAVIHPGMVYEPRGGVFRGFLSDATRRDAVRVTGGERVRWPLVHAADLAELYRLALEGGAAGESYIGVAVEGLPVGQIARAFAQRFGTARRDPEVRTVAEASAELGEWARGYALDQQLSGDKARRELGWQPRHLDPLGEIAALG